MKRKLSFKSASALSALTVVVLVLLATSNAIAQSWQMVAVQRGGGAKPAATPVPRKEPATTSIAPAATSKAPTTTKATSARRTSAAKSSRSTVKRSTSSAGHEKGTAPAKATEATASTPKGSRQRRVTDSQSSTTASSASAKTETGSSETKATAGRCNPDKDEHADLSGSYSGVINYPAAGLSGPATLTVTGNRFTLTSGSKTEAGNITAVVTCNYTAVAMMFGQWKTPQPGEPVLPPLPMLSLTATRKGDQLTLKPSASEHHEFLFEPGPKK